MNTPEELITIAKKTADLMASGQTTEAIHRLQSEARHMSSGDFRRLVALVGEYDQRGQGADLILIIQPDGTTTVAIGENKQRAQWVADIKGCTAEMAFYPTPNPIRHFLPNSR